MSHFSHILPKLATTYVKQSSRYAKSKVKHYTENRLLTFDIYKRTPTPPISPNDQWLEITPAVEYRPDLVSYEIYGTPDLWWRIMEMNNMKDILEFKAGKNIRISGNIL
jgi:hypothetical protein